MVAYQDVSMVGVSLKLRPECMVRRICDKYHIPIPYFHFQKPIWDLEVERLPEDEQPQWLYWYLRLPDGTLTGDFVGLPEMKIGEKRTYKVGHHLISPIGGTSFCVTNDKWAGNKARVDTAEYHTLCTFRSTAEDEFFMLFIAAFLGALIAMYLMVLR